MGIPICTHIIPHNEYIPFLSFIFLIWILFLSFFGKNNKNYSKQKNLMGSDDG